uniref:Uncharacterized protein n=1 Tax=Opuntia streptacantha TaxID=393608 RepID=A0A7C9F7Q1_OPUST
MSTGLTGPASSTALKAPPISSWSASMSTSTRLPVAGMSPVLFSWISSLVPWTASDPAPWVKSSDPIILCSGNRVLEIIGLRAITPRVLNSLIRFLMLSEKRLRIVMPSKVFDH